MSKDNEYFEEILVILYEEDLAGLVPCGCPKDEYACEAARISDMLKGCESSEELAIVVDKVFETYLQGVYDSMRSEDFKKVAERVWLLRERNDCE